MDKVLVVDDEENIVNLLKYALRKEGYEVETAFDGYEASEKIASFNPDVILLDIMMPNRDGYQVCREFCGRYPIIMLTAKSDIVDKVAGMELGADDYITKPFDIREVVIRIKALLRRKASAMPQRVSVGDLMIIKDERRVILKDQEIDLTPIEYSLLCLMADNLNRVFSRDELLDKVWGYEYIADTRSVDIQIQRLRKKLLPWSERIKTIYGSGYKISGEK